MSFIAKNPLTIPEVDNSPSVPQPGTRALFAGKGGWYDIDSSGNTQKLTTGADIGDLSSLTTTDKTSIVEAINEKKIFYLNATEATLNNISDDGIYTLTLEADVHQQTTGEILIYTNEDNTDAQIFLCVLVERFRSNTVGTYLSIPSETVIKNALLNPIKSTTAVLSNNIDTHTTDTQKHISAEERTLWNTVSKKANKSDIGDRSGLPNPDETIVDNISFVKRCIDANNEEMSGTFFDRMVAVDTQINNIQSELEDLQTQMGDVETALDNIIEIQNTLIGGDAE